MQRPVAQLPWAHHVILLDNVKSAEVQSIPADLRGTFPSVEDLERELLQMTRTD